MAIANGRQRGHASPAQPTAISQTNAVAAELGDRAPQVVEAGGAVVGDPFCDRSIPRQHVQRRGSWSVVPLGAEGRTQPRDRSARELIFRLARDCGSAGNPRREVAPQHNSVAAGAKSKRDDSDGQDPEEHGGRETRSSRAASSHPATAITAKVSPLVSVTKRFNRSLPGSTGRPATCCGDDDGTAMAVHQGMSRVGLRASKGLLAAEILESETMSARLARRRLRSRHDRPGRFPGVVEIRGRQATSMPHTIGSDPCETL